MMVATPNPDSSEHEKPVLLVVEDETLIRMDLADHLRIEGFKVMEAASPREARAALSAGVHIDLVLSDIHMPGRDDGLSLLRWISETFPKLPIVAASGVPASLAMARGVAPTVVETVEKPYHARTLAGHIREHLSAGGSVDASG